MNTIRKDFYGVSRSDEFYLYILTDIHSGIKPCREDKLARVVSEIASSPLNYWLDLGDRCDFINRSDPRFSPEILADWLTINDLSDLAKAQSNHYLNLIKPIARQCLGLVEGNHEAMIRKYFERDIYRETICGVKELGKFPSEHKLEFGYSGWLILNFYQDKERRNAVSKIKIFVHHGHGGGQLAGGPALVLERVLLRHDCDLALLGHNHRTFPLALTVEEVDNGYNMRGKIRQGAFCGTFFDGIGYDTYATTKGYPALPVGYIKIILRPHSEAHQRIEVIPQFP